MPCAVDATGPQVGAQQLLAAEHVQRQVAVAVVVAVEEAALLLAVQRVVGGVEVQHQLFGRGLEAGDELLDQHLVQAPRGGPVGPLLQPAQRGRTGDLAVHAYGRLHGHVAAQRAVVVQILPAQRQAIHALAQHVAHAVLDQQRAARVGNAARGCFEQAQLAIDLAQQHHAAVAGHAAAIEAALHDSSAKTAKLDGPHDQLLRYSLASALPARSSRFDTSINGHPQGNAVLVSTQMREISGLDVAQPPGPRRAGHPTSSPHAATAASADRH